MSCRKCPGSKQDATNRAHRTAKKIQFSVLENRLIHVGHGTQHDEQCLTFCLQNPGSEGWKRRCVFYRLKGTMTPVSEVFCDWPSYTFLSYLDCYIQKIRCGSWISYSPVLKNYITYKLEASRCIRMLWVIVVLMMSVQHFFGDECNYGSNTQINHLWTSIDSALWLPIIKN